MSPSASFLRVPPFPGARPMARAGPVVVGSSMSQADAAAFAGEIVRLRVGGTFWEAEPTLLDARDLVLRPSSAAMASEMILALQAAGLAARAVALAPAAWFARTDVPCSNPRADPWHVAEHASEIWTGSADDLALVGALLDRRVRTFGEGRFATLGDREATLKCLSAELASAVDPFTGAPWAAADAIAQLGEWRALIEQNRIPRAIYGIARWKRVTMDALLWDGSSPIAYAPTRTPARRGDTVLAWRSRVAAPTLAELAESGVRIGEIEDGMIRSQGLGANCVPPLSVIVDLDGVHFDPSRPSALEHILANQTFSAALLERAAKLRARLIATGLSKYGVAAPVATPAPAPSGNRRVLVTGQVEDDRSVLTGGGGMTNLALLDRARALEPTAHITYRPHPDVEAGHRKGRIADADALRLADAIERDGSVTAAIDAADALHVITSLAGFEALMRGKNVVTHGVPFFAGWGLTEDHGAVPARRGRERTIDELVAAVLILYPRYLDPLTRLPCPVEILVERLAAGTATISSPLVRLRTWQGKIQRWTNTMSAAR